MYPTISDLINDIFGTSLTLPIQSFGFFVALSFLIGSWIMKLEFKRKEKEGLMLPVIEKVRKGTPAGIFELIMVAIIAFSVGYKVSGAMFDYETFSNNTQDYILSLQGNIWGGLLIAAALTFYRFWDKNRKKLPEPVWEDVTVHPYEHASNILLIAAIAGLLGAKLFDCLENIDRLISDPIETLFSFMGLTFYGGLIVGSISVLIFARRKKMNIIHLLDVAAPAILLAYAIGRTGCFISGDGCWGIVNLNPKPEWLAFLPDWMWAYNFPHNVINEGIAIDHCTGKYCTVLEYPVYPTAFYDMVTYGFVFSVLMLLRKKIHIPGMMFSLFLIIYGAQRFMMELLRVNNKYNVFGLQFTQAELISVFMIIAGISGIWFFRKRWKNQTGK
jgi:prolipoprotein diacylglyceryl transferase